MRRLHPFSSLFPLALLLAGCGGGGGSDSNANNSGGATSGTTTLFMTDSLDDRDHVWVTVKKVVLIGVAGDVTAFDDATGITVDLKTLRDASGERYSFLSNAPSGTYTGLKITVARTARVFARGSSRGEARDFSGAAGTDATLSLAFATPRTLANGSSFTVDFDLGNWSDDGSTLTGAPFLREGKGNGLGNPDRHEHEDYRGLVQNLTGTTPNLTFNLIRGGRTVRVVTDAATSFFNSNGADSPTLANGKRIEVRGAFSAARTALAATSVKIEDDQGQHGSELRGAASTIDANAGTFTLAVGGAEGFLPAQTTINVVLSPNAIFRGRRGATATRDEFFVSLAANGFAEVEGRYDEALNVFTATKLKVEDKGDGDGSNHGGREAEFRGATSAVEAAAKAFSIAATRWEGVNVASGTVVRVVTNDRTEFHGLNAAAFFAALTGGRVAEAEGAYNAETKTLIATKVKLEGSPDSGGSGGSDDDSDDSGHGGHGSDD